MKDVVRVLSRMTSTFGGEESLGHLVNIPWGWASGCQPVKTILIYTHVLKTDGGGGIGRGETEQSVRLSEIKSARRLINAGDKRTGLCLHKRHILPVLHNGELEAEIVMAEMKEEEKEGEREWNQQPPSPSLFIPPKTAG